MATGGGKGPPSPSHPPPPPTLPLQRPSPIVGSSDSLQTPDTSSLFMTTLSGSLGTPPSSFTSLEELLNVTGINTPVAGTKSLEQLARDAEKEQGLHDDDAPIAKRPRLDSLPTTSSVPANIRVQPLNSNRRLSVEKTSAVPNMHTHTITSLFDRNLGGTSSSQNVGAGSLPQTTQAANFQMPSKLPSKAQFQVPQQIRNNRVVSSTASPSVALLPTSKPTSQISGNALPIPPSTESGNAVSQTSPQTGEANAQRVISSPKALLVQLVQLYKQYQAIGNEQGMQQVKKQLSELTALMGVQQQLLATRKQQHGVNLASSAAGQTAPSSTTSLHTASGGIPTTASGVIPTTASGGMPPSLHIGTVSSVGLPTDTFLHSAPSTSTGGRVSNATFPSLPSPNPSNVAASMMSTRSSTSAQPGVVSTQPQRLGPPATTQPQRLGSPATTQPQRLGPPATTQPQRLGPHAIPTTQPQRLGPPAIPTTQPQRLGPPAIPSTQPQRLGPHAIPTTQPQRLGPHAIPTTQPQRLGPPAIPTTQPQRLGPHAIPTTQPQRLGPHAIPTTQPQRLGPHAIPTTQPQRLGPHATTQPQRLGPHAIPTTQPQRLGPPAIPTTQPQRLGPHAIPSTQPQRLGPHAMSTNLQVLTSPPPSLLSHMSGQGSQTNARIGAPLPPQSQALRLALQSYRLKQLQAFLQSLPPEKRPRSMEEIREIIQKHPDLFQGLPHGLLNTPLTAKATTEIPASTNHSPSITTYANVDGSVPSNVSLFQPSALNTPLILRNSKPNESLSGFPTTSTASQSSVFATSQPTASISLSTSLPTSQPGYIQTPQDPGIQTSSQFPGIQTSTQMPGIQTSTQMPGMQTSTQFPGIQTSAQFPGIQTSTQFPGIQTSTQFPGIQTSTQMPGIQTSTQMPGMQTSTQFPGMQTSTQMPGMQTSAQFPGIQTSTQMPGIQTSTQFPGMQTSTQFPGMQTSAQFPGIQTSTQFPGIQTSTQMPGMQTSTQMSGMQTSTQFPGMQTSAQFPGMQTSTQMQGMHTSTQIPGIQTSTQFPGMIPTVVPGHSMSATPPLPIQLPATSTDSSQLTNQIASQPIQPGVPTPLPPGITLEMLTMLCRTPESELVTLKLPPALLTAIRVWRMRQGNIGPPVQQLSSSANLLPQTSLTNDIPVIIPQATNIMTLTSAGMPSHLSGQVATSLGQESFGLGQVATSLGQGSFGSRQVATSLGQGYFGLGQDRLSAGQRSLGQVPNMGMFGIHGGVKTSSGTELLGSGNRTIPFQGGLKLEGGNNTVPQLLQHPTVGSIVDLTGIGLNSRVTPSSLQGMVGLSSSVDARPYVMPNGVQARASVIPSLAGMSHAGSQPLMIHPSQGFPPRSLHAFVPSVGTTQSSSGVAQRQHGQVLPPPPPPYTNPSTVRPLTRYQLRVDQQKAEREKLQALNRVLQSSAEARITYMFTTHLERMHSQLLSPDTQTPFRSLHDAIARLLPYHVWNEPEQPSDAYEKADNVYDSVAQLLLSQSQGLMNRFQQILTRDAQHEWSAGMDMCVNRLLIEGEHERKEQEKREKQQAEQIAANLSLIAGETGVMFDADFSFGDVMNSDPMFPLDTGIT